MARRLPTIRFQGTSSSRVKELKILGVILDSWFTCMPHANYLKSKIEITVQKLTRFLHMHCRLPSKQIFQLYTQLVHPVIMPLQHGGQILPLPIQNQNLNRFSEFPYWPLPVRSALLDQKF